MAKLDVIPGTETPCRHCNVMIARAVSNSTWHHIEGLASELWSCPHPHSTKAEPVFPLVQA